MFDDPVADILTGPRRGVITIYPVIEGEPPSASSIDPSQVVLAFRLLTPADATVSDGRLVTFKTKDGRHRDAAIVDVDCSPV